MSNALMFYREVGASPEISHLVLSFWEFVVGGETGEPKIHEVFPDGCVSILYYRNENFGAGALFVHGLTFEIFKTEVYAGDCFWGMRLSPAACQKILRFSPAEIQSQSINETKSFPHLTGGLLQKLIAAVLRRTKTKTLRWQKCLRQNAAR